MVRFGLILPAVSAGTSIRISAPDFAAAWALAFMIPRLKLAHFAKDATILSVQSGPVANLYIIQRGLVGRRPDSLQADPDRTLGAGELFPVGALSAGGTTTKIFHAIEDTRCYTLGRADFLELRRISPEFERYCTQAITETLKQSLESLYSQYSQRAAEQQTLTRTLGDLQSMYVALTRGYKAGGINTGALVPDPLRGFDPEYLWNLEAGWRVHSADRRFSALTSVFMQQLSGANLSLAAKVDYLYYVRIPGTTRHFFTASESEFLRKVCEFGYACK